MKGLKYMQDTSMPGQNSQNNMQQFILPGAVVALIAVAAIALYASRGMSSTTELAASPTPANVTGTNSSPSVTTTQGSYADGEYSAEGMYITPGGPRNINISLTIENGVVTNSTFEGLATDPTSQRFQQEFGDNYQPMIVGKSIDEVQLTKVSGSSLTPQGFMDALQKIKTQAQS